jgi:hypothetical protein
VITVTAPHDPPTYQDNVPDHLKTAGQLRADGLWLSDAAAPAGWWVQTFPRKAANRVLLIDTCATNKSNPVLNMSPMSS